MSDLSERLLRLGDRLRTEHSQADLATLREAAGRLDELESAEAERDRLRGALGELLAESPPRHQLDPHYQAVIKRSRAALSEQDQSGSVEPAETVVQGSEGRVFEIAECQKCGRYKDKPFTCKGDGSNRHEATEADVFYAVRLRAQGSGVSEASLPTAKSGLGPDSLADSVPPTGGGRCPACGSDDPARPLKVFVAGPVRPSGNDEAGPRLVLPDEEYTGGYHRCPDPFHSPSSEGGE